MEEADLVIIVMGVSGSGKTTVGSLLAASLGWEFADADDYHSRENVEKMSLGVPLTDVDRVPWLQSLRARIGEWLDSERDGVLACSALRQTYRNQLRINEDVHFVYLKGTWDLLAERLLQRRDHYMKQSMLQSQLATLEEPADAVVEDAGLAPEEIVHKIRESLALR